MTDPAKALTPVLKPKLLESFKADLEAQRGNPKLRLESFERTQRDLVLGDPEMHLMPLPDRIFHRRLESAPATEVRSLSFSPLEGFNFVQLDTIYEGKVSYQAYTNFWTRITYDGEPNAGIRYGDHLFATLPPTRDGDIEFLRDLVFSMPLQDLDDIDPEQRAWMILAPIWIFLKFKTRINAEHYNTFTNANRRTHPQWSLGFYRKMWEEKGEFVLRACNDKAVLLGYMLAAAGLEPWRHGICFARYGGQHPDDVPAHVYNTVYYAGRWRILDLNTVYSLYPAMPWVEDDFPWVINLASAGTLNCDYAHPVKMEQPRHKPILGMPVLQTPAVPLLGCAPYSTEVPDPYFAPPS